METSNPDAKDKGFTVNDKRWWLKEGAEDQAPPEPEARKPAYVEELEDKLRQKEETLVQYIQAHKSSVADLDDVRKRLEKELDRRVEIEKARVCAPFLEVLDNLGRFRDSLPDQALAEGMDLVLKQIQDELAKLGLVEISVTEQRFDPRTMEALITTAVGADQDGVVLQMLRAGYQLGEQVVRPAGVRVGVHR